MGFVARVFEARVLLRMTPELADWLAADALHLGLTRSELVRRVLEAYLRSDPSLELSSKRPKKRLVRP